jgi:hypothetical protein
MVSVLGDDDAADIEHEILRSERRRTRRLKSEESTLRRLKSKESTLTMSDEDLDEDSFESPPDASEQVTQNARINRVLPLLHNAFGHLGEAFATHRINTQRTVSDAMVILYYRLKIKWRMAVTAMQIISTTTTTFSQIVRWPPAFAQFLRVLQIFNLDFMAITPTECYRKTTYYHSLAFTTLSPLVLLAAVALYAKVRNAARSQTATGKKYSIAAAFVFIWFFVFPACSTKTLVFWYQHDGGKVGWDGGGAYHRADLSLRYGGPEHARWQIFAIFMVFLWPIGTPATFFLLVWRHRHRINPLGAELGKMDKAEFNARTKILTDADIRIEKYKMLWLAYKYEHWYFETVVCMQRLLLTGFMTLVYPGTALNVIYALVIVLVSLKIFTYYEPYMDYTDNDLTEAFHWVFILLFVASLVLVSGSTGGAVTTATLIFSLLAGLGTCLYMMLYDMHRERHTINFILNFIKKSRRKLAVACGCRRADADVDADSEKTVDKFGDGSEAPKPDSP